MVVSKDQITLTRARHQGLQHFPDPLVLLTAVVIASSIGPVDTASKIGKLMLMSRANKELNGRLSHRPLINYISFAFRSHRMKPFLSAGSLLLALVFWVGYLSSHAGAIEPQARGISPAQ